MESLLNGITALRFLLIKKPELMEVVQSSQVGSRPQVLYSILHRPILLKKTIDEKEQWKKD